MSPRCDNCDRLSDTFRTLTIGATDVRLCRRCNDALMQPDLRELRQQLEQVKQERRKWRDFYEVSSETERVAEYRAECAEARTQAVIERAMALLTARCEIHTGSRMTWADFLISGGDACPVCFKAERDAYRAKLEQIAMYPVGTDWGAAEAMQRMAAKAVAAGSHGEGESDG